MPQPTTLTGYPDDAALTADGYAAVLDLLLEHIPELIHPQSVRTFARMRHEPQLGAILRVYQLALERAKWTINGDGCRDEVTQALADDLGLPIKGVDAKPTGWVDQAVLAKRGEGWVLDDIVFGATWDFGNHGRMQDLLRQVPKDANP